MLAAVLDGASRRRLPRLVADTDHRHNVLGAEQGCDFDFLRADGIEHADYGPLYARMGHS